MFHLIERLAKGRKEHRHGIAAGVLVDLGASVSSWANAHGAIPRNPLQLQYEERRAWQKFRFRLNYNPGDLI